MIVIVANVGLAAATRKVWTLWFTSDFSDQTAFGWSAQSVRIDHHDSDQSDGLRTIMS